jgi:hypothetical protein
VAANLTYPSPVNALCVGVVVGGGPVAFAEQATSVSMAIMVRMVGEYPTTDFPS